MRKLADISTFETLSNTSSCFTNNVAPAAAAAGRYAGAAAGRYAGYAKAALPYAKKAYNLFRPYLGDLVNMGLRRIVAKCIKKGIPLDQIIREVQQVYQQMAPQQAGPQFRDGSTTYGNTDQAPSLIRDDRRVSY